MTQSTPILGSITAGTLAQVGASPWWIPLVIQLVSLLVGYIQGKKAEVRKETAQALTKAADAPAEMHGGVALLDERDQT